MSLSQSTCRIGTCLLLAACWGCGSGVRDVPHADGRPTTSVPATAPASSTTEAQSGGDDFWKGLERHEIQLEQTLLLVKGSRGIAACPYLDIDMFTRTGEACVIIPAARIDGMLDSRVTAVTPKAKELGIDVGMSGREALEKIR